MTPSLRAPFLAIMWAEFIYLLLLRAKTLFNSVPTIPLHFSGLMDVINSLKARQSNETTFRSVFFLLQRVLLQQPFRHDKPLLNKSRQL